MNVCVGHCAAHYPSLVVCDILGPIVLVECCSISEIRRGEGGRVRREGKEREGERKEGRKGWIENEEGGTDERDGR